MRLHGLNSRSINTHTHTIHYIPYDSHIIHWHNKLPAYTTEEIYSVGCIDLLAGSRSYSLSSHSFFDSFRLFGHRDRYYIVIRFLEQWHRFVMDWNWRLSIGFIQITRFALGLVLLAIVPVLFMLFSSCYGCVCVLYSFERWIFYVSFVRTIVHK